MISIEKASNKFNSVTLNKHHPFKDLTKVKFTWNGNDAHIKIYIPLGLIMLYWLKSSEKNSDRSDIGFDKYTHIYNISCL